MKRVSIPLQLIRVPEKGENRLILKKRRAKKATVKGLLRCLGGLVRDISWYDKRKRREKRGVEEGW
jgi:hypothetical protein